MDPPPEENIGLIFPYSILNTFMDIHFRALGPPNLLSIDMALDINLTYGVYVSEYQSCGSYE